MIKLNLHTDNHPGNPRTKDVHVEDYMLVQNAAVVLTSGKIIYTTTHQEDVLKEVSEKGYLITCDFKDFGIWEPTKLDLKDIKEVTSIDEIEKLEKKKEEEKILYDTERCRQKFEIEHAEWVRTLGKVFKQMRLSKGWSVKELAHRTPFSTSDIELYESGEREIGDLRLKTYAKTFDTTVSEILEAVKWHKK
ncbi:helix-turn-helix transcriptional regulator [Lactobacillus sp.]|uniref:helix-turn-helix domain-containing protein n=1 Tax=Lactobacillus sp. TaxID=1591 RepID=UPI0019AF060D|nr:helix-turn-helix transcriptional regulator [Lactobacillus sp.]MBD5430125.1 helix-turn-helix transcriptional regulator [Lactobacillus sp.]